MKQYQYEGETFDVDRDGNVISVSYQGRTMYVGPAIKDGVHTGLFTMDSAPQNVSAAGVDYAKQWSLCSYHDLQQAIDVACIILIKKHRQAQGQPDADAFRQQAQAWFDSL